MGTLRDIYTLSKSIVGLDFGDDVSIDDFDNVDIDNSDIDGSDSIDSDAWGVDNADEFADDSVSFSDNQYDDTSSHNPSFQGNSSDAKNQEWYDYYKDKEKHAIEEENWHLSRAKKALENGDERAYNDHISRAKSWHSDADSFKRSANIYRQKLKS